MCISIKIMFKAPFYFYFKNATCNLNTVTYFTTVSLIFIFDKVVTFDGLVTLIVNLALKAGSSKHGKALLASVGENCVLASILKHNFYYSLNKLYAIFLRCTIISTVVILTFVESLHFIVYNPTEFDLQFILFMLL